MKRLLAIVLMTMLLIMAGCQQTPEKAPIIGKAVDYLENVEETPFQPYEAPSSIKESEEISGLDLKIDAEVTVPDTDGYSVMEVSKQVFDVDTYKIIMNYFHPDEPWFKEPVLTKDEIIQKIAYYQETSDLEIPENKETIQELQDQLADAPEEAEHNPFFFDEISNEGDFYAYCKNKDDGIYSVLSGRISSNHYQYVRVSDEYWLPEEGIETDQEKNDFLNMNPSISLEEAQKKAQQALRDLNADPAMLLSLHTKSISYKNDKATSAGWEFYYTRDCNGLQASYVGSWDIWKGSPAPVNMAPWEQECTFIIVDDKGIAVYDIRGAGRQNKVLYKNVELLAFDDILERIKQQLVYNHAYQQESVEEYSVVVNEIKLVSSLVNVKDQPDVGRLIPSWDVVYDYYERFAGEKEPSVYHCHTYFNAIDGSYIEPRVSNNQLMPIG